MVLTPKKLNIHGKDVTVETRIAEGATGFFLKAECDGVVCEHTVTIGAEDVRDDGKITLDSLRSILDGARQRLAEKAEFGARLRKMMAEVI